MGRWNVHLYVLSKVKQTNKQNNNAKRQTNKHTKTLNKPPLNKEDEFSVAKPFHFWPYQPTRDVQICTVIHTSNILSLLSHGNKDLDYFILRKQAKIWTIC